MLLKGITIGVAIMLAIIWHVWRQEAGCWNCALRETENELLDFYVDLTSWVLGIGIDVYSLPDEFDPALGVELTCLCFKLDYWRD